jgi:8-oxo-dGTP pyrophosphatase MutT (NUDIX family)
LGRRRRVAVCCTRRSDDGVDVLMVHDRSGRWTLPKGAVERRESVADAAVREALEEAGVSVVVDGDHRTVWKHRRRGGRREEVVLLAGRGQRVGTPDEPWRRPTWVPVATLAALADEDRHYRRIHKAVRRLGVRAEGRRRGSEAA